MSIYKVLFAKNQVIACEEVPYAQLQCSAYEYEHNKGQLIYALIKAPSEEEARQKALGIVREVTEKTFGTDFISY